MKKNKENLKIYWRMDDSLSMVENPETLKV